MPFKQDIFRFSSATIHLLWYKNFNPNEFLDHLTDIEKERLTTFSSLKRRMEFTATRILRHSVFGFTHIHYTETGSPYIPNEGFISISHAEGVVGIGFSKKEKVAIDLEQNSDQAMRLHEKFLNDREKLAFNCQCAQEMTKLWSAKEVLYKLASKKGIHFKEQLHLFPASSGYNGEIWLENDIRRYKLISEQHNNLVITLNEIV